MSGNFIRTKEEPKLVIPPKRYTGESVVISMRIPKDLLAALDTVAQETGRTRNELLTLGIEFALDHLVIKE